MTSIRPILASAAVIGLALVQATAAADEPNGDAGATPPRVVTEKEGVGCVDGGGRVSKCTETTRVATQRDLTVIVKIAPMKTKNCQATMSTIAEQRNTVARV